MGELGPLEALLLLRDAAHVLVVARLGVRVGLAVSISRKLGQLMRLLICMFHVLADRERFLLQDAGFVSLELHAGIKVEVDGPAGAHLL